MNEPENRLARVRKTYKQKIQRSKTDEQRFWEKVHKNTEITSPHVNTPCWIWDGAISKNRYGVSWLGKKRVKSHRASWIMHNGRISSDIFVLHHCDNPLCIRSEHLFLGTAKDNVADCIAKNRRGKVFGSNHANSKLTEDSVKRIKKLINLGINHSVIGEMFGVTKSPISKIKRGLIWCHVQ